MHKRRPGYHRIILSYVWSPGAATRPVSLYVFTPHSAKKQQNEPLHSYSLTGRPLSSSDQAIARAKGADTRARLIRGSASPVKKPRSNVSGNAIPPAASQRKPLAHITPAKLIMISAERLTLLRYHSTLHHWRVDQRFCYPQRGTIVFSAINPPLAPDPPRNTFCSPHHQRSETIFLSA